MKMNKTTMAIFCAMILTACGEAAVTEETAVSETGVTEMQSSVTETEAVSAETAAAVITESTVSAATVQETTETEMTQKRITNEDCYTYLAENGYKFQYSTLYIDMNDYWDGSDPLEDIDGEYLKDIHSLVIENAGDSDISFLENYAFQWIELEKYSSDFDFSRLPISIVVFDDYRGGDLSSLSECGNVSIRFENYSGREDMSFISGLKNIDSLRFEYFDNGTDFSFLSDCPHITFLSLTNKSINAGDIARVVKNSNINRLYISVEEYSAEDAELIMKAVPQCAVSYNLDDSPWNERPCEGVAFLTNPYFYTGHTKNWECQTDDAGSFNRELWHHVGSLVCTFSNFTDDVQRINTMEIFRNVDGSFIPLQFPDGSYVCNIDFSVDPGKSSDLEISN